jgi:uncharacterized DUF497 family protein
VDFEWDPEKNAENIAKHQVSFEEAKLAWLDPRRVSRIDKRHSRSDEQRRFLYGRVRGSVLTVRYTRRGETTWIIGAGYWRDGKDKYEEANAFRR